MPRYWFWHAKDLLHFLFNLARYSFMCGIENVDVQFWPKEKLDGEEGVLKIVDTRDGGTVLGEYDYVHKCPPECE